MIVSVIVAAAENGVIGKDNQLPWRLPADLKRFKEITIGHPVIMGRKTFESIGKVLPGRKNIIISRNADFKVEGAEVVTSLGDALKLCAGEAEAFIIGGGMIFQKAFDLRVVDKIYFTLVHGNIEGDAYFHLPEGLQWVRVARERHEADEKNQWAFTFMIFEKRTNNF
jgi:dihydrofolate reductase